MEDTYVPACTGALAFYKLARIVSVRGGRKLEHDGESPGRARPGRGSSAVPLHDLPHDRKPQPRAALTLVTSRARRRGAPIEAAEHQRELLRRNSWTVIAHHETVHRPGSGLQRDLDVAAGMHVAKRVDEQVLQRLLHAPAVRVDPGLRTSLVPEERQARFSKARLKALDRVAAQRRPVEALLVEGRRARLEARQLEQITDEQIHAPRLVQETAHVLRALLRRDRNAGIQERLRVSADGRERRGQLVRDVREELPALELRLVKLASRRGEPIGHAVELLRDTADLIAALVRDPDREVPFGDARREHLH